SLTCPVGYSRDPAVVQASAAIEYSRLDAGVTGLLGQQFADGLRALGIAARRLGLRVRSRRDRMRGNVVDELGIDVLVRSIDREPRPLGGASHLLAHTPVPALPVRMFFLRVHHPAAFAALPAFLRTNSPSYRMPLPLYGSG